MCALERGLSPQLLDELGDRVLRRLGYETTETANQQTLATLDEALEAAASAARPKGAYRILPVLEAGAGGVRTETGTIRSSLFTHLVQMCTGDRSIVYMILTLGDWPEQMCTPEEPVHRQLVFDAVGSELAEMEADRLEAEYRAHCERQALECSDRFSPGYCDWPLEGQAVIAAALDFERVGVRLSPRFVMTPRKSVSAVAVAAREVPVAAPCALCKKDDCSSRRLPWSSDPVEQCHVL